MFHVVAGCSDMARDKDGCLFGLIILRESFGRQVFMFFIEIMCFLPGYRKKDARVRFNSCLLFAKGSLKTEAFSVSLLFGYGKN